MKLYDIHTAISSGKDGLFSEQDAFATLVAIEYLAKIEGIPLSALDFSAPKFGEKYTSTRSVLQGSWRGKSQYLVWRNLILNAQFLFEPGDVDADPWASLSRADRLWTNVISSKLSYLSSNIPPGTHPRDVTDELLFNVSEEIQNAKLIQLRSGVACFRELFENDLALRSGLLPKQCPEPLPDGSKNRDAPMSAQIEAWFKTLDSSTKTAFRYINRIAIFTGQLNGKTDTLDDLRSTLCDLPHPIIPQVHRIQEKLFPIYVRAVIKGLGGPDPRKTPAEQAWANLRAVAHAQGCEIKNLWALRNPAAARGIFPDQVSQQMASEILLSIKNAGLVSLFRHGCEQFDALRGVVPADLLPPHPLGIRRPPPRAPKAPKPILPPNPVKIAWADLYARLRERGWGKKQLNTLSYLPVRACAAGIAPKDLSQDFIGTLENKITTVSDSDRLRCAVRCITTLSNDPEFRDLPNLTPPAYTKFTHGGAGEQARAELEELMAFMNAAPTTRRGFRVAVGVLTDAMMRPDIPLKDLLQADMSAYDIGDYHEPRRQLHTDKIGNLRAFIELTWTPAWRELQKVVVETGMTAQDNPVPKVLGWNPGTEPNGLRLEWAQKLDREYRSTLKYPPHGRTYTAHKLARHLAAFDALHDIPEVARSGLLPPRIGPIRQKVS